MKKVIVIGARSGIGLEIASSLSKQNYHVGITGRRTEMLESLQREHPDNFIISAFDLTNLDSIKQNLDDLAFKLNGIDLIILSSGDGLLDEPLDFALQQRIINLNISGFTIVANYAFNYFQKQGFGHFCAITSIAGLRGNRRWLSYVATKSYQINYLQGLSQKTRCSKLPIFITDVRPGFVGTAMAKGDKIFWNSSAKKVAIQIVDAIKNKKKVIYITRRWQLVAIFV